MIKSASDGSIFMIWVKANVVKALFSLQSLIFTLIFPCMSLKWDGILWCFIGKSHLLALAPPLALFPIRSIRQSLTHMWRETLEKEEDEHQEEHSEPHLQRGHHLRHPAGQHGPRQPAHLRDGLRLVRKTLTANFHAKVLDGKCYEIIYVTSMDQLK